MITMSRQSAENLLQTMREAQSWMSIECEGLSARQMRLSCPELKRLKIAITRLEARLNPPKDPT